MEAMEFINASVGIIGAALLGAGIMTRSRLPLGLGVFLCVRVFLGMAQDIWKVIVL